MKVKFYVFELKAYEKDIWQKLLDILFKKSNIIQFAKTGKKNAFFDTIKIDILDEFQSHYRWFNKQLGTTNFIKINLTPTIKEKIRKVDCLDDWTEMDLEDPTFFRSDELLAWTISHERLVFVSETFFKNEAIKIDNFAIIDECIYDVSD